MKNDRRKNASTVIELSLIILLCTILGVLFAQYCLLKNTASVSTAIHPDHSFLQNNDTSSEDDLSSPGIVVPEFVGFVSDSKQLTPVSSDARRRFISETKPYILNAFSDISTVMEFSSESAKNEYVEDLIRQNGSYLYFRFAHDLPAGCFVPAVGGYTLDNIFHAFNVKDLFVFCSETGEISGIALDSNGNLASLSVRDRSSLSFENFSTADLSDGMARFEFVSFADKKYPVLTSTVAFRNIAAYTDTEDFTANDDAISSVLDTFGFNPNSTSFYRTEGNITYVEQAGEFSISSKGDIRYSSSGEGIHLSEFLSEQKDTFSFEDKIIAARSIIEHLDKEFFGGYASICLSSVTYNDKLLTLDFSYMADGILIEDAKNCATLVFDDSSLTFATANAKSFARLDSTHSDIPQKLLFAFSSNRFDEKAPPKGFPMVYSQSENAVYVARSAVLYSEENPTKEDAR